MSHFHSARVNMATPKERVEHKLKIIKLYVLYKQEIYFAVVVVLAQDILVHFGKSLESSCAFYEFIIYRNIAW